MTANIIRFIPRKELKSTENLNQFIELCKYKLALWDDLPGWEWANYSWSTYDRARGIRFTDWEHRNSASHAQITPGMVMGDRMQEIAKAYIRYRHTLAQHKNAARELMVFRAIEVALKESGKDSEITNFNEKDLNRCFELLSEYKAKAALASVLVDIMKRFADLSIVTGRAKLWSNPFIGKASYQATNGAKAASSKKASKLPDQSALLALAEIFSKGYEENVLDDTDIMVTSIVALLLSTPMRVAEILRLRVDCLKSETDKNGITQYYLNYWVPKIGAFDKKAIPASMAPIAIEAINRLIKITNKSRELAAYYETNPTSFYKHDQFPQINEDGPVTRAGISLAMGYKGVDSYASIFKKYRGSSSPQGLTLNKIWNEIVIPEHKRINPYFPYQENVGASAKNPLKMSESLFCFRYMQFSSCANTSPIFVCKFGITQFTKRLSAGVRLDRKNQTSMCIFTKHGHQPIRVKSHSLRHFLNHLAFNSGVSVESITAWSSRGSLNQTFTYVDDAEYLNSKTRARKFVNDTPIREYLNPIDEDSIETLQGPFQRTVYGLCLRSWKAGPCNKTFDCLNCSEILMCKGDRIALDAVKKERQNLQVTYDSAQSALEAGERAATRWLNLTGPYLKKLGQLEDILTNSEIPDGSPIQISGCNDFSPELGIVQDKMKDAGLELLDKALTPRLYSPEILAELGQLKSPNGDNK